MSKVNDQQVMQALGNVLEPERGKDIVSLNMVRNLVVHDGPCGPDGSSQQP